MMVLISGCNNKIDRTCKVIERGERFDIELYGAYARVDDRSCCVVPKVDTIKKEITVTNSFIYCTEEKRRRNITIR